MLLCAAMAHGRRPARPSPLADIESRVQARAKDLALDVGGPDGAAALRALIDHEVGRWREDHRRGLHDVDVADPEGVADRACRNLAGYGPLEPLLGDPDVWEIMVNAPDSVFVRRHAGVSGYHSEVFHDDEHVIRTLTKILDDATGSHRKLDPAEGLQDAQLDDGARLHIVHGDVGRDGHVLVNIRKFTGVKCSFGIQSGRRVEAWPLVWRSTPGSPRTLRARPRPHDRSRTAEPSPSCVT